MSTTPTSPRRRPTSAHLLAGVALFVALGGTSYAAGTLGANSVGSRQVKNESIQSLDIKNGSLQKQDFKPGQLPAGPKGDKGDPGAPAVRLWAVVDESGGLLRSSGGGTVVSSSRPYQGIYRVTFDRSVANCAYLASQGQTAAYFGDAAPSLVPGDDRTVQVATTANATNTVTNRPFALQVVC